MPTTHLTSQSEFDTYAEKVKTAGLSLSNEQKGELYGLFKQAKEGDNTKEKPGMLSAMAIKGKWDNEAIVKILSKFFILNLSRTQR